jgi:hypothetical protein
MFTRTPEPIISGLVHQEILEGATIELWDAWAFAEVDAELALKWWWKASDADRADAFAGYTAALERETQAARALEARLTVTGTTREVSA